MDIVATIKTEKPDEDMDATKVERKPKTTKRKKIRRLADNTSQNTKPISKCKRILVFTSLLTFTIALLMGHYYTQNNSNAKHLIKEFLKNYRNQYTQIVHGKPNYCDQAQNFATQDFFERIKQYRILNQEKSIQQIEVALRNDSDLNAIALVGGPGVGKSSFVRAIADNFPWQENVHSYVWNTYVADEAEKFSVLHLLVNKLSDCGQNLMIIENLKPCDHGIVPMLNRHIMDAIAKQKKRVILFYVFSLNTMLTSEQIDEHNRQLQPLSGVKVINFNSFGVNELRECIAREVDFENVELSLKDFNEIVATIDVSQSGCKNVNAKVRMYGTIKSKDNL